MRWPWVSRASYEALKNELVALDAQYAAAQRVATGALPIIREATQLRRDLAAERSLTADLFVRIADLERWPAPADPDALPPVVLAALNERAPMRGNRHLRALLERDARAMLREGALRENPEVVAAMILNGDRVE